MKLSEKIIRDIIRKRIIEAKLSVLNEAISVSDYKISDQGVSFALIKDNPSTITGNNPVYHELPGSAENKSDGTQWCNYNGLTNNTVRGVILESATGPSYFIPRPFFTDPQDYNTNYDNCSFLKKLRGDSEWKILGTNNDEYKEAIEAFANAISNARSLLETELNGNDTPFDALKRLNTASSNRPTGRGWESYMYQALKTVDGNDYSNISKDTDKLSSSYSGGDIKVGDRNLSLITKSISKSGGQSESFKQAVYIRAILKPKNDPLVIPGFTGTALAGTAADGRTIGQQMLRSPPGVVGTDLHWRKVLAKLNNVPLTDTEEWWADIFSDLVMGKDNSGKGYSYSDFERLSAAYSVKQELNDPNERFSLGQRIYKSFNSDYDPQGEGVGMPDQADFYANAFTKVYNKMRTDAQTRLRQGLPLQWSQVNGNIQAVNYDLVEREYRESLQASIDQLIQDEDDIQTLTIAGAVSGRPGTVSTNVAPGIPGSVTFNQSQTTGDDQNNTPNRVTTRTTVPSDRVLGIDMRLDISSSPGINSFDDLGYVKGSNKKIKEIIRSLISSNKESNFRGTTVRLKVYYNDKGKVYKIAFLSARDKISSIVMTKFKKELKTSLNNLSVDDFNVREPATRIQVASAPITSTTASTTGISSTTTEIKGHVRHVYTKSGMSFTSKIIPDESYASDPAVLTSPEYDGEGLVMEEIPNPSRDDLSTLWYEHVGKKKMDEQGRKNKTFVRINFKVY